MDATLKDKVVSGVSWNVVDQALRQALSLGVTAVIARILHPDDYGLVALSAIFVGFITLFESLAVGAALIQRADAGDDYVSTSFWTSMGTGILLAVALAGVAPLAAAYYEKPVLHGLIALSAVSLAISPIASTHRTLLTKKLKFRELAVVNILNGVVNGAASIALAATGFGVWSLVAGGVIATAATIPALWWFERWRPRFIFSRSCFRDLFGFSSYLLSFNVINYFARNADNLIVGKVLGTGALGIYSMAYSLMMKPLQHISWSVTSVLFPAFSSIQDDIGRMKSAYLRVVRSIALITFPMMIGLMMVAHEFILVAVGPKWEAAVAPLQVLCLVGALQSVGTTVGSIFNSLGRADLQFKTGIVNTVGHLIGFVIGIQWGLMGLVYAYLATNVIFVSLTQVVAMRLIGLGTWEFLKAFRVPTIASFVMWAGLALGHHFDSLLLPSGIFAKFVVLIVCGIIVYVASVATVDMAQVRELLALIPGRNKPAAQAGGDV